MKYLSVCSGIEAASVAWESLGWEAVGFSEIEPFPCAVLRHRFPDVPLHGDFTALIENPPACDVLVGGTPCQAFSVAGSRRSLEDARGNLTLAYVELANAIDRRNLAEGKEPCITVWENVPGVFSTSDNAFGCFLRGLAGGVSDEDGPLEPSGGKWTHAGIVAGPQRAVAWRVLDAQYFGLAQRRQRVFVVSSARDGFDPSQVLLEWEGVRRDSAPSREARKDAAAALGGGVEKRRGKHGRDDGRGRGNGRVEVPCPDPAGPLGGASQSGGFRTTDLDNNGSYIVRDADAVLDLVPEVTHEIVGTLNHAAGHAVPGNSVQDCNAGMLIPNRVVAPSRAPAHAPSSAQGSFPWPQEVADPLTSNEAKTYTHEDTTFRTRNVVPHVVDPPHVAFGISSDAIDRSGEGDGSAAERAGLGIVENLAPTLRARANNSVAHIMHGALNADEGAAEVPAYCYPDADQLGYAPGDEAPETPSSPPPASTQREAVALSFNQRDEPRFSPVAYSLQTQPGNDEQLVMAYDMQNDALSAQVFSTLQAEGQSAGNRGAGILSVQAPFVFDTTQVTHPANFSSPKPGDPSHAPTLVQAVPAYAVALRGREGGNTAELGGEIQPALRTGGGGSDKPHVLAGAHPRMVVRRLTPRECERLQGFPDDWTLIPWKNKPAVDCPDGPRYKALGNSMAVPVMRWIGRRIDAHVKGTSP